MFAVPRFSTLISPWLPFVSLLAAAATVVVAVAVAVAVALVVGASVDVRAALASRSCRQNQNGAKNFACFVCSSSTSAVGRTFPRSRPSDVCASSLAFALVSGRQWG